MTWSVPCYRSIIDYILTNKKQSPLVNETKVYRGIWCHYRSLLINFQNLFTSKMVYIS